MTDAMLNESSEWTGTWWLPDQPDEKVPGVLNYHPNEGLQLRLIGGWNYEVTIHGENGSTVTLGEFKRWPLVLGTASNGQLISLVDVNVLHAKITFGFAKTNDGPDVLHLQATTVLVGCHLGDADEDAFVAGVVTVENLTAWSARSGIERRHTFKPASDERNGEIGLTRLDSLAARADGLIIKLHHLSSAPFAVSTRASYLARVEEHASVEFVSEVPQQLSYWNKLAGSVADLISLSTLSACAILSQSLYLPATPESYPEDHPLRNQRRVVQVYQRMLVKAHPEEKALDHQDFLLTLRDRSFEDLLPRWISVREKFAAAQSMILGLQYVSGGFLENRVVTAVAAAEAMHRALDPAPPIPFTEFKALRKALLAGVDPKRKKWLADRLTDHSNVPTLKERLLDLADRIGPPGSALVADPEQWAKAAKDARNTLAHVGSSGHEWEKLHAVVEVTSGIVILNLLHELGVQEDRLTLAVRENPGLSRSAELAKQFFRPG